MAVYCGKDVVVNGEGSCDMLEVWSEKDLVPYTAGNTEGGVDRNDGNNDWGGRYRLYKYLPARFPGDSFTLSASPKAGAANTVAVSGTAICTKLEITWDVRNARYIDSIVHFAANGALSTGQAAPAIDATEPAAQTAKGLTVNWDSSDIANVDYMKLVISVEAIPYADSTSAGQIKRVVCDLDVQAMWRVNDEDSTNFPTLGAEAVAQFNCTSDPYYWEVKWLRIRGVKPWGVDRRGQKKPVQRVVYAEGAFFDGSTTGWVKTPEAVPTTKWPFS